MGYFNELKRAEREQWKQDLAQRSNRADAIIAAASIFGLLVLLIIQLSEKAVA